MPALLYDTGALVAAERREPLMWRLHDRANAAGIVPVVPVVVRARRRRRRTRTRSPARAAGRACAAAGTSDVVDALVVVTATRLAAPVVTSDPNDLARLASSLGARLALHPL